MQRSHAYLLALLMSIALPSVRASAQQEPNKLHIGVGAELDFAGGVEYDVSGPTHPWYDDARATIGARGHLDYAIARHLSLGGFARVTWWRGTDTYNDGRNLLADVGARLQGHYDLGDFRFYGVLMVGPSISRINHENHGYRSWYGTELDNPAIGVTAGVAPGAEYWISEHFGVFTEIFGWSGHWFKHDLSDPRNGSVQFRLHQVMWQFGLVIAPR